MKINYRLEKKNKLDKTGNIRLDSHYNGKRFRYFIGMHLEEKLWSCNKQRLKSSATNSSSFNQRLNDIKIGLEKIYYDLLHSNLPISNEILRNKLDESLKGKSTNLNFFQFAEEYIEQSRISKKESTVKGYMSTIRELKKFEKYQRRRIDWDAIDMKFYADFKRYQYKFKGNSQNLFGKRIKDVKAISNDAYKMGVNIYQVYKCFKVEQTETDAIYLNDDEINRMYELDFSNDKRLELIRDISVICCEIGTRFSDYKNITKERITENRTLKYHSQKSDKMITTVCPPRTIKILKKYGFVLPHIAEQTFNLLIKEIGKCAGIDKIITHNTYRAGKSVAIKKHKYKLISSHTGRRSFATNLFLKGVSSLHIMKATGHKMESDFLRYIKQTSDESMIAINRVLMQKVV